MCFFFSLLTDRLINLRPYHIIYAGAALPGDVSKPWTRGLVTLGAVTLLRASLLPDLAFLASASLHFLARLRRALEDCCNLVHNRCSINVGFKNECVK